jgi:hypothetical protein
MSELTQYDEMQARFAAAYEYHVQTYSIKNPPPAEPQDEGFDRIVVGGLALLVLSSVIVSGSRTIDEFGGGLIGWSAFAMLELGVVTYAYVRTKRHYDEEKHKSLKRQMTGGMLLALVVAVVANIHATAKQNDVYIADWINTIISLLVAISAPVLAFIAGDILGMEAVATQSRQSKAMKQWREEMERWREGLNRSWDAQKARLGIVVEVKPDVSAQTDADKTDNRQTLPAPSGFTRTPDGQRKVIEYLNQYPEDAALPSRQLAVRIAERTGVSVGHDTANKGRNAWRNQQ